MDRLEQQEIIRCLEQTEGSTKDDIYHLCYQQNPEAYETPVLSWEEFCGRFVGTRLEGELPTEAPTYISTFLEESFFPAKEDKVALVINRKFCPPFLHRLAFIKIVYVLRGSCFFMINGQTRKMEEGAFCLVGPEVEQAVYSCHDEDLVVNLLMRFGTFAESFQGLMQEQGIMSEFLWRMLYGHTGNSALIYTGKKEDVLSENVMALCEEILLEKRAKSNLIRNSLLMIFYGNVLRLHERDLLVLGGEKEVGYRLPELLFYMNTHLTCTLPEAAAAFGLSEGYLSRYIRQETGRTFRDLLREFRMKEAAKMLINTDFTVDKIVETVGYTDKSRFYRNFVSAYQVTPVRYREGGEHRAYIRRD